MPIATRLANTGSLLVNNSVDEVSMVAGSISFNGTSQYLTTPVNTGFDMGTGDFTIECFVINLGYSGSQYGRGLFVIYPGASYNQRFTVRMNSSSNVMNMYAYNGTTAYLGNSGTNGTVLLSDSTKWYHIAVVRQSGVFRLYVNGVQDIIVSNQTSESLPTSCVIEVGRNQDGTVPYWNGLISNFRVVKGTAVYPGPFTPPQAILPAITNTQLLLNVINSTNFIKDSSPNALTLTNNGTASFTASSPFGINTMGAISFNGTSQYLYLNNQSAFAFGTADFTLEAWIYPTQVTTIMAIYDSSAAGDATATGRLIFYIQSGLLYVYTDAGTTQLLTSSPTAIVANTWQHIAISRASSVGRLFINGALVNTNNSMTTNFLNKTNRPVIGANGYDLSGGFSGYMTNFRTITGTAAYTAAFTPAGPLYPITNTSFLLNVTSSASLVLDSSSNNFTVTNSGATFAASRPSTGILLPQQRVTSSGTMEVTDQLDEVTLAAGSLYFNGTSQYLSLPGSASSSQFNVGTGAWTIECWLKFSSVTSTENDIFESQTTNTPRILKRGSSSGLSFDYYAGALASQLFIADASIVVDTWYHIAVARSAGTLKGFVNGVQVFSVADTTTGATPTAVYTVGGRNAGSLYFPGYISNFRFVNGTALYTNPFTPPQSILPAVANTTLLLNMATSTNSTTDSSSNTFTVTNNGSAQWAGTSPYNQTNTVPAATTTPGSVRFNGTNQYFSLTPTFSLATTTTPFTMEAWVYFTAFTGVAIASTAFAGSGGIPFVMGMGTNSTGAVGATPWFAFWNGSAWGGVVQSTTSLVVNTWYHLAYVYTGAAATIYANGTGIGTAAVGDWQTTGQAGFYVGRRWDTAASPYYAGYISNFRFVNGTAVYTAAFTPPTAPLTAIANTVVLLNTASSGTLTTDSSSNNYTVTNNNTATYSSLNPFTPKPNPNGAGSVLFNGTSQYLSVTPTFSLATSTTPFTLEAWVYFTSFNQVAIASTAYAGSGAVPFVMGMGTGSTGAVGATPWFGYYNGSAWVIAVQSTTSLVANTWYHLAYVYTGSTATIYANGTSIGTAATAAWQTTGQAGFYVGRRWDTTGGTYFAGYISNFRFVNGTAVYTSNFNVPTKPLTVVANTSLLMNTSADGRIFDISANNYAITNNATATYSNTVTPFPGVPALRQTNAGTLQASSEFDEVSLPAGAVAFNGTNQYLSIANNTALNLSSGDFTIEAWVLNTVNTAGATIIQKDGVASSTYYSYNLAFDSSGYVVFGVGSGNSTAYLQTIGGTTVLTVNIWYHIAAVKLGTTLSLYINGILNATATQTGTIVDGGKATLVGYQTGQPTAAYWSGYISNLRVVKGTALYTTTFTPPQTVLPSVTNTQLLLNVINSTDFIKDSSPNNFTLTNTGTAIWTPQGPYNQNIGSISFNGSSQYLSIPTNAAFALPGDFTIESWVYVTSFAAERTIIDLRGAIGTVGFLGAITITTGYPFVFKESTGTILTSSTAVTLNAWTHVAFVRSGTTLVVYVNGVNCGSVTDSTSWSAPNTTGRIGANKDAGSLMLGYISNLRVVKGTAVYTSSFVPPIAPLTTQPATTSLLLNVLTSPSFITDSSVNNFTLTNVGTATWNGNGPFNSPQI